jgi:hypothetical protein
MRTRVKPEPITHEIAARMATATAAVVECGVRGAWREAARGLKKTTVADPGRRPDAGFSPAAAAG